MTTAFYGADTDQLRTLAERFHASSQRIDELRSSLQSTVLDEGLWRGPDADAWRGQWQSVALPNLGSIAHDIDERRGELEKQAEEQDTASSEEGTSLGDTLLKMIKLGTKALGLYKVGKSIVDGVKDMKRLFDAWRQGPNAFNRVWESLKLRNYMKWASDGFAKLFKTVGGKLIPGVPGDIWKKIGGMVDSFPAKLAEGGRIVEKIAAAIGPEGVSAITKGSRVLGKIMPGVDIALGALQLNMATDGYGKTSGVLSMAGGTLMLAGVAFPPLAVAGAVLSGASLAMDVVDLGGELLGHDPSKAVSEAVGRGLDSVGSAVQDGLNSLGNRLGSIFG